ncbi:MAG: DUF4831 family protein [Bacteroidales bacterium]
MKKGIAIVWTALLLGGCAGTESLQVGISAPGQEPEDARDMYRYGLPRTVLRIEVVTREEIRIPGPYREYAGRLLGVSEVIAQKSSSWSVEDVRIAPFSEWDPARVYSLNVTGGSLDDGILNELQSQGLVLLGGEPVSQVAPGPTLASSRQVDYVRYLDMGIDGNFEERTETMYKTLVTDTSFVRVPVERKVVEEKSVSTKAGEAAEFILELRSRRFDLLTGEYNVFPQGEAMKVAIDRIDALEESYLSLFVGKTLTRIQKRVFFVVPADGKELSRQALGMFSSQLGFVPRELGEGEPLEVILKPQGLTRELGRGMAAGTDRLQNALVYRVPDVVELQLVWGGNVLSSGRVSVFQSGDLVSRPLATAF